MIKEYGINKFIVATCTLVIICLLSIIPNRELEFDIEVETLNESNHVVYLLDEDNYVSKLGVFIEKDEIEEVIKEKIIILRDGSEEYNKFIPLIPKDTKINSVIVKEDKVYIDFSVEFLSVKSNDIEAMIESIVYSLTEINGINEIYIYIDGEELKSFPNGNYIINQPLNRDIGINKEFDIINFNNLSKTTIYFIKENDDLEYYVPVTKITNDDTEKISIIIDELKSSVYSVDNLYSYLSNQVILDSYNKTEDTINLIFNDYIFESVGSKIILEEVKYTIAESIFENYDVNKVIFSTKDIDNIETYIE